jgi:hypothetical protein
MCRARYLRNTHKDFGMERRQLTTIAALHIRVLRQFARCLRERSQRSQSICWYWKRHTGLEGSAGGVVAHIVLKDVRLHGYKCMIGVSSIPCMKALESATDRLVQLCKKFWQFSFDKSWKAKRRRPNYLMSACFYSQS